MKLTIRVGHVSYGEWCLNHPVTCRSKSAAVRELQNRFVTRRAARHAVADALKQGGSSVGTETPGGGRYCVELLVLS